jgi:dihydrofolate reductase
LGIVTAHMSMSLDGFIAGPNAGPHNPLGDGGERVQEWMFELASFHEVQGRSGGETNRDDDVLRERFAPTGAVVLGRRMFDEGEGPWGDDPPFHAPVFVLTHRPRDPVAKEGGTTFTFVTDGIESAVEQARAAASAKNVNIAGGGETVRQSIEADAPPVPHPQVGGLPRGRSVDAASGSGNGSRTAFYRSRWRSGVRPRFFGGGA